MKTQQLIFVLCGLFLVFFLAGCAANLKESERFNNVDENWGKSFHMAVEGQILNPDAGHHQAPVKGMDGQASEETVKKYKDSFKKAQQTPSSVININNGPSSSK